MVMLPLTRFTIGSIVASPRAITAVSISVGHAHSIVLAREGAARVDWIRSRSKKNNHYAFCTHRDLRENVWCKNRNTNTHRIRCALDTISAIRPSWELMSTRCFASKFNIKCQRSPTHQRTQFLLNPAHWSLTFWPGSNLTFGADTGDNNYCVCNDLATKGFFGKILGYRMSVWC